MDFYRRTGELIFGTRLKRISDKFLMDVSKIYKSLDIPFETSWFPLFYLLNERGELPVTEIAKELKITHSAISQMVNTLEKKKLIKFLKDKNDRRKRLIYFTPQGLKLIKVLVPIWKSIKTEMEELLKEKKHSRYLLLALDELEDSMEENDLYHRVIENLKRIKY